MKRLEPIPYSSIRKNKGDLRAIMTVFIALGVCLGLPFCVFIVTMMTATQGVLAGLSPGLSCFAVTLLFLCFRRISVRRSSAGAQPSLLSNAVLYVALPMFAGLSFIGVLWAQKYQNDIRWGYTQAWSDQANLLIDDIVAYSKGHNRHLPGTLDDIAVDDPSTRGEVDREKGKYGAHSIYCGAGLTSDDSDRVILICDTKTEHEQVNFFSMSSTVKSVPVSDFPAFLEKENQARRKLGKPLLDIAAILSGIH